MRAQAGLGGAHELRQAIDATDFDATAHPTKPHVNGGRDRQVVWVAAWVLPKQWVAGSNPVSRSKGRTAWAEGSNTTGGQAIVLADAEFV